VHVLRGRRQGELLGGPPRPPPEVVLEEAARWRRDYAADFFLLIDSIATTAPGFLATFPRLAELLDGCSIMLNSAMPVFRAEEARAIGRWRGPVSVWFGLETASEGLGRRILGGKWQGPAIEGALGHCAARGIDVGLNCIFGFADETRPTARGRSNCSTARGSPIRTRTS
jgi:hypothetical protein